MKPAKTALLAGLLAVLAACGSGPEAAPPQTVGGLTSCVVGPPGSLDLCFGVRGKVITDSGGVHNSLDSIAVQPDGMIVGVVKDMRFVYPEMGEVRLVRYYPDGTLDPSFAQDRVLHREIYHPEWLSTSPSTIALQPDGKIVVVVMVNTFAVMHRFNPDGSPDMSFARDGSRRLNIADSIYVNALAIQSDGKIIVAGGIPTLVAGIYRNDFLVARYNSDGWLDTDFDGNGVFITSLSPGEDIARSVAIQSDDKIVVGGYSEMGTGSIYEINTSFDFALIRLQNDGSLDPSFSGDGKVTTGFGSGDDGAYSIAIQPDGQIVAAGYAYRSIYSTNTDIALVRYNPDGSLDTSFGLQGKLTTAIGTGDEAANSVVIQNDGKIVVGGYSYMGTGSIFDANPTFDFALVRYDPSGSLDTTFGKGGKRTTNFGTSRFPRNDYGTSLAIQPDGLILLAGQTSGTTNDAALARYNP